MSTENISPFRRLTHARYDSSYESFLAYTLTTNAIFNDFKIKTRRSHHFLMPDLMLVVFVSNYPLYHYFDVGSERWSQLE